MIVKSNGNFSIIKDAYEKTQHPNQQAGLNLYVDVLDHSTGQINSVKLYENSKGLFFKKGSTNYLLDFDKVAVYIPFQVLVTERNGLQFSI